MTVLHISDCFTRIEDHMRTGPVHRANINREPGSSKRAQATVPAFTSPGFQTLQSNRSCNIYIKKKRNIKSGTWKPPAHLTNSAVLTGSGSVSRARLNQTFRDFSHYKVCSETEADRKTEPKGKASDMRERCNEGADRDNCKKRDRTESNNNEAESISDHCVNADVAFLTGKERDMGRMYDGRGDKGDVTNTVKFNANSMKELNAEGQTGNGGFIKSTGDFISSGSTSSEQNLHRGINKRPSHPSENSAQPENSANRFNKPGNVGTLQMHNVSLRNREVVENPGAHQNSSCENPTRSIGDQQTNQSLKTDHFGSKTVVNSTENRSCITHSAQPSVVQYAGNLSSLEATECVSEKHCKRSGLTVRFDLPRSIEGDDDDQNSELGMGTEHGFVSNINSEARKTERTVGKILPKKSILKAGNVDEILLQRGGTISSSESSFQGTEMNLERRVETRNNAVLREANPELKPGITTMQFDTLGSNTTGMNLPKSSAISCGNPGDIDEAIDLECMEKICFTEDGNVNPASNDLVERISPRLVDNRIEYTIDDIKTSKNKTVSKKPKKINEGCKRQRNSKRKEAIKESASKQGMPGNEMYKNTRKSSSDNQKSSNVVDIAQLKDKLSVEASSERMVNGTTEKFHGASDNASLSVDGSHGQLVEVDIVFETTSEGEPHIKHAENIIIEPHIVKELAHSTKTEKDYSVSCIGLVSSTDKEKEDIGLKLDTSNTELCGLPCDENHSQSHSKNNQHVPSTASGITGNHHSICSEINKHSTQTFTDSPQSLMHDVASTNAFHSLDTESKRCASNQEDSCHSKATPRIGTDFRTNGLAQVKTNENVHTSENDGCDIIAANRATSPSQNSCGHLLQDCIHNSNTGFQIISREIHSVPHKDSRLDESTVKREPFHSDIFAIYLSDDSNDSTDNAYGMSKLPADRGTRIGSEFLDKNNVGRSATPDRGNTVGISDVNQVPDLGADGINLTGNSPELIPKNCVGNNTPCSINSIAKDTSECSYETDCAFEGSGPKHINNDMRIDQAKSRKGLACSGKEAESKQNRQMSKIMTKSKKRKSGSNLVSKVRTSESGNFI